jgi:phage shock protein PspC (stress-responsive transcriptional regulator)
MFAQGHGQGKGVVFLQLGFGAMSDTPRLERPKDGRVIAGVAAGLADRFGMRRGTMRLLFVISLILPGPQILIYLILWIVIPEE